MFARRGDLVALAAGVEATRGLSARTIVGGEARRRIARWRVRFDAAGWRVWWLAEGNGAAARWLATHEGAETLGGAVLIATAPVSPELLRMVKPRLVILRPSDGRGEAAGGVATLPSGEVMTQERSGAVTLEVYPERIEARGFVDGRTVTIRK